MIRALRPAVPAVRAILLATCLLTAARVQAQPMMGGAGMPNLRAVSGRPLPDAGMPAGMITVRVARKIPANGVGDAEVTAIIEGPGGEARKRTAKTDASGRATFEAVPAGHRFRAEVVVDKERLATETFPVPASGGVRTMLIAGLPPPGQEDASDDAATGAGTTAGAPGGDGKPGRKPFSLGVTSGLARFAPDLPTGVVEVLALDQRGRPIPRQRIEIGRVLASGVEVSEQVTGADGRARFTNMVPDHPAGAKTDPEAGAGGASGIRGIAAAVVMDHMGQRISTEGFELPLTGGTSVELKIPELTSDPSVITIGEGGRLIVQLREDGLGIIETFPLENTSEKIFDPGPGGVEIPLPSEAVGAEGAEGAHKIEIRKGIGVAVHGPIPPHRLRDPNGKSPDEVTFGFVLPTRGSSKTFEQKFPNGITEFTFATEQIPGLTIESAQISGRQDRDFGGKKYWLMRGAAIPAGGTLRFTVHGLPAPDPTGRMVSGVMTLGLIGGSIVLGRRRGGRGAAAAKEQTAREKLIQRREKLFAELVAAEERRTGGPAGATTAVKNERDELVRKLEGVYRELATLDEQRAT